MEKLKSNRAVVMVQPFDNPEYESQEDYLAERNKFLEGKDDLFILTRDVENTRENLRILSPAVLSLEESSLRPTMGWKEFSRILRDYREVIFCGAELHVNAKGLPYAGSLLELFQKTPVQNKRIYFDACWARELP